MNLVEAAKRLSELPRCNNGACQAPATWSHALEGSKPYSTMIVLLGCDRCTQHRSLAPDLPQAAEVRPPAQYEAES